jgi:hypothetical protein
MRLTRVFSKVAVSIVTASGPTAIVSSAKARAERPTSRERCGDRDGEGQGDQETEGHVVVRALLEPRFPDVAQVRGSVQGGPQENGCRRRQAQPSAAGAGQRANLDPQARGLRADHDALAISIRHEGNCMIGLPARPA